MNDKRLEDLKQEINSLERMISPIGISESKNLSWTRILPELFRTILELLDELKGDSHRHSLKSKPKVRS